jgi:ribosome assembly protein 4
VENQRECSWAFEKDGEDPVPFSFHVSLPQDEDRKPGEPTRIVISKSIEADILDHSSHAFTQEDVFVVHCAPQAVFRVRPATRCSSTLSGEFSIFVVFSRY